MRLPILLLACSVAAFGTLILLWILRRRAASLRLLDLPNERSAHETPVPRVGGVAIAFGWVVGLLVFQSVSSPLGAETVLVVGFSIAVGGLGFVDDRRGLSVRFRLAMQTVAAGGIVLLLGGLPSVPLPPPLDLPLSPYAGGGLAMLWLVGVTNFFNFMDGLDGLAGGQASIACVVLAVHAMGPASNLRLVSLVLLGPLLLFWAFNRYPASIFLGDGGSYLLGFFLAASPWLGAPEARGEETLIMATCLILFLLDPAWTLWIRWRHGASLTTAHRDHCYQRLARRLESHSIVSTGHHVVAVSVCLVALGGGKAPSYSWAALGLGVLAFVLESRAARSPSDSNGAPDPGPPDHGVAP